jgi:flagellar hook-associated protein 3 FlgL
MSFSLTVTDFGMLDQTISASALIKQNIAQLTAETSSGYVANDFAGLGANAGVALDLSQQISAGTVLQGNVTSASNIQQAAQSALGQIESIASNFAGQATTLETNSGSAQTLAASAQDAMQQVAQLLDTKFGDAYVFGGQDSDTPPVPDPADIASSAFAQAIQQTVSGLVTNGAAATSAATLAIASPGGMSPFAPSLDHGGAQSEVDLGDGVRVALAPLANANSNATSAGAGATSTGSYTRDILLGLASLASLGSANTSDASFLPFVQGIVTTMQGAVTAINTDIGALGDRQDQVSSAGTELGNVATALQTQLSSVQEPDLAQVTAQLSAAQTQLQASYQIIAGLSQLSLAKYI